MKKLLVIAALLGILAGCASNSNRGQGTPGTESDTISGSGSLSGSGDYLSYPTATNH